MSRAASNDIERAISTAMRECIDDNVDVLTERCQAAGERAVRELKQESRKRSGKYAKGWKSTIESSEAGVDCTVHNRTYQLTHLLENDHEIKNQTGQSYGTAKGDKVIASIAERVGEDFASDGDAK